MILLPLSEVVVEINLKPWIKWDQRSKLLSTPSRKNFQVKSTEVRLLYDFVNQPPWNRIIWLRPSLTLLCSHPDLPSSSNPTTQLADASRGAPCSALARLSCPRLGLLAVLGRQQDARTARAAPGTGNCISKQQIILCIYELATISITFYSIPRKFTTQCQSVYRFKRKRKMKWSWKR